jgi:hypothetical protein
MRKLRQTAGRQFGQAVSAACPEPSDDNDTRGGVPRFGINFWRNRMINYPKASLAILLAAECLAAPALADWKDALKEIAAAKNPPAPAPAPAATPAPAVTAAPAAAAVPSPAVVAAPSPAVAPTPASVPAVAPVVAVPAPAPVVPAVAATAAPSASALSQDDVVRGLKETLSKATQNAVAKLGKEGGFLNNAAVKIAMPESMAKIDKTLRKLGQDKYADQFVAAMNQAAEKAVPEAANILADSIRDMSLEDAQAILKGKSDAATQYFRKKNEAKLMERLKPIVTKATDQAGVTSAYKAMTKKAGGLAGLLGGGAGDLDGYVTEKSLDGLFKMVAEEEKNIRANPVARSTDLLKKLFDSLK